MAMELEGFLSSCLVRSPVCALHGKSGEGLANLDFSGSGYRPDMPSELDSRQQPMLREDTRLELAGVGNGARLLEIGRWVSGCCRRLLSWLLGSLTGPSTRWLTFWVLEPRPGSPAGRLP